MPDACDIVQRMLVHALVDAVCAAVARVQPHAAPGNGIDIRQLDAVLVERLQNRFHADRLLIGEGFAIREILLMMVDRDVEDDLVSSDDSHLGAARAGIDRQYRVFFHAHAFLQPFSHDIDEIGYGVEVLRLLNLDGHVRFVFDGRNHHDHLHRLVGQVFA